MAKTLQIRYREALETRGAAVVGRMGDTLKLTRPAGNFYFVGPSGSVRFGRNKTESIPVSDTFKARLLTAEET